MHDKCINKCAKASGSVCVCVCLTAAIVYVCVEKERGTEIQKKKEIG